MKKIFFYFLFFICHSNISWSYYFTPDSLSKNIISFEGKWLWESDNNFVGSFTLFLIKKHDSLYGQYCGVNTRYHMDCFRDDDEYNIHGKVFGDSAILKFYSSWGAKNGLVIIKLTKEGLLWRIIKKPTGGEDMQLNKDVFYAPMEALMVRKIKGWNDDDSKKVIKESSPKASIAVAKCMLYKEPNESSITKGYLVKDDEVIIIEDKKDWLKIEYYSSAMKKTITRWIKSECIK